MSLWYLARAAGLMAVASFTFATTLGALGSGRARGHTRGALSRRFFMQRAHIAASLTGLILLGVHVAAVVLDSASGVWAGAAVLPMTSAYRPLAVTAGVLAMYLFVLAAAIGASRGRLAGSAVAARWWRVTHASAYVGWALSVGHGLFAGTDSSQRWAQLLYAGSVALVATAVAVRLWSQDRYDANPLSTTREAVRSLVAGSTR